MKKSKFLICAVGLLFILVFIFCMSQRKPPTSGEVIVELRDPLMGGFTALVISDGYFKDQILNFKCAMGIDLSYAKRGDFFKIFYEIAPPAYPNDPIEGVLYAKRCESID